MKKYLVDNKYFDNEQKAINRFAKRILTKGKSEIKVYKETDSEKGKEKDNYETLDYFNLDDFAEGYKWKEYDHRVVNVFVDKDDKLTVRTKPKPKKGEMYYEISLGSIKDYCLTFKNLKNDTDNNTVSMSLTFGKPKNV